MRCWVMAEVHWVDLLFMSVGFGAWFHNMDSAMKLDLNWLIQFYGVIRGALLGNKAIDSRYNSPPGVPPGKEKP